MPCKHSLCVFAWRKNALSSIYSNLYRLLFHLYHFFSPFYSNKWCRKRHYSVDLMMYFNHTNWCHKTHVLRYSCTMKGDPVVWLCLLLTFYTCTKYYLFRLVVIFFSIFRSFNWMFKGVQFFKWHGKSTIFSMTTTNRKRNLVAMFFTFHF